MKKSISTILSCLALLLFLSPLMAQNSDTNNQKDIIIIQKATGDDGVIEIDQKSLEKGDKFQNYLEQFNIIDSDAKHLKLEVFTKQLKCDQTLLGDDANEETIFFYRSADSGDNVDQEDLEKLIITLNNDLTENLTDQVDNQKPLLGVYSESGENGVLITGIVYGSGAQKAGIKKGDIITALNGQSVRTSDELSAVIVSHEVGESISVDYIRDGAAAQTNAVLGTKQQRRHYAKSHHYNYNYDYHYDYKDDYRYNSFQDRDLCKPFIGVYTSKTRKGGLKVYNTISNTAADRSNIQVGDVIVALDDVEVNSHRELVTERDKHQAGDFFTLSIQRDGQQIEVDAQFDACPTEKVIEPIIIEETPEELPEPDFDITQNNLELESFTVFPNPTYGPINLKFQGAAVPTTIRVTDAMGKTVYEETLNNFDGIYNKEVKFRKAIPGTMILTVQQGQKVYSETLVLMPKA